MYFRDIPIGATFDFIGPDRMLNSFFDRCTKTGRRSYEWTTARGQKLSTNVGSVKTFVHNVQLPEEYEKEEPAPSGMAWTTNEAGHRVLIYKTF